MESRSSTRKRPFTGQLHLADGRRLFHNDLIVAKIAKYMPTETLLALRQTCINWNRLFIPHVQESSSPIRIEWPEWTDDENDPPTNMQNYTKLMMKCQQIPFSKYKLDLVTLPKNTEFFTEFGPSITSLVLIADRTRWPMGGYHSYKLTMQMLRPIILDHTPNLRNLELYLNLEQIYLGAPTPITATASSPTSQLPNLQSLDLNCSVCDGQKNHWFFHLLDDLFHSAVALEYLWVNGTSQDDNIMMVSCLRDFAPRVDKLKDLTAVDVNIPELEILIAMAGRQHQPLRLGKFATSFCFEGWSRPETAQLLYQFLVDQSIHLREFSITLDNFGSGYRPYKNPTIPVRIPRMQNLKSFKFVGTWLKEWCLEFEGGTLLHNFPQLQKFDCRKRGGERGNGLDYLADPTLLQHHGVTEFKFDTRITELPTLRQLAGFYPSVVHVDLRLHKCTDQNLETYSLIWATWPMLQTLNLYCDPESQPMDYDGFLTGVSSNQLESLGTELVRGSFTLEELRALQQKYKTLPGLSDLRHLVKFSIRLEAYCRRDDIQDSETRKRQTNL